MPDVLNEGSATEQLNYIEERTRIYENFRAIREDMFQKIKRNIGDTLTATRNRISLLITQTGSLNKTIDSLDSSLETAKAELAEITRTKNSIKVLGIEVNKATYNSIMWIIVGGLVILLGLGFLVFKRNRSVTLSTRKEFNELKAEFEQYRQKTREAREKMSMDHFNEMKRLKGG